MSQQLISDGEVESLTTSKELGPTEKKLYEHLVPPAVDDRSSSLLSFIESLPADKSGGINKSQTKIGKKRAIKEPECNRFIALLIRHRITMDIQAWKKGGEFQLPGEAHLHIPEGLFLKKETITVAMIPPNRRHEFCPAMKPYEKLASNIYLVHSKSNLKGKIGLQLSAMLPQPQNLVALYKPPNEQWQEIQSITKLDKPEAEPIVFDGDKSTIQTSSQGAFVLLEKPLEEFFPVTPNGALLQARINHLISLRIPKRCTTFSGQCVLKIFNINERYIQRGRAVYPRRCNNVDSLSPFYDFSFPGPAGPAEFKRPVTLKLPQPDWATATDDGPAPDLTVMVLKNQMWEIHDAPLKITKSTVSFDTNTLTRFCMIRPRKDCRSRAHLSMDCLELCNQVIGGEILVFAMLDAKAWHVWAECVRQSHVVEVISDRVKKGFTFLNKLPVVVEEEVPKHVRTRNQTKTVQDSTEEVEFRNGVVYLLALEGDLQFKERTSEDGVSDTEAANNCIHLQFNELFNDNYRLVEIEPKPHLREKAEAVFLERVASERAAKAQEKEKEAALKKEKSSVHPTLNGRSHFTADHRPSQNGVHDSSDPYAAPLPSPTPPGELATDQSADTTEEDVENELSQLVVNCCINCRLGAMPTDEPSKSQGDSTAEPTHAFARYPLSVDVEDLIEYFGFEPPPEVDPEEEARAKAKEEAAAAAAVAAAAKAEEMAETEPAEKKAKPKTTSASFQRLTASTKRPTKIIKESKVLNGRSLQVLSRSVQNGLTLAVHLNLPDSVITGIGFDSLSNLHCLNDVTYKVLMHWKRTFGSNQKEDMVPQLVAALKQMQLVAIAAVVADRHRNNTELTPGCFDL